MADEITSLEDLEKTRKSLIKIINEGFSDNQKEFLLTFKNKTPDWNLLELEGIKELPAVRWKLMDLKECLRRIINNPITN